MSDQLCATDCGFSPYLLWEPESFLSKSRTSATSGFYCHQLQPHVHTNAGDRAFFLVTSTCASSTVVYLEKCSASAACVVSRLIAREGGSAADTRAKEVDERIAWREEGREEGASEWLGWQSSKREGAREGERRLGADAGNPA